MKEFKLLRGYVYGDYTLPIARRGAGRIIANELLLTPRTRECAVIASSVRDFNNWRTMTFDRNNVFIITNRDFLHTNGVSGIPTRYRSISRIDDCRGLTFDRLMII